MSQPRHFLAALSLGLLLLTIPPTASGQSSLATRVPNDANAMLILNVDKIMASEIAREQDWKNDRIQAVNAGLTILPASANRFLMAANLDLDFMHPVWEIAVSYTDHEPNMVKIAAGWNGEVEQVSGHSAVQLPDDSYVIELGIRKLAAMRPANRQQVARWLRSTDLYRGDQHSAYMKHALGLSRELGTPILLAIDLEGAVSATTIKNMEGMKDYSGDADDVAERLATIRGATLGLNVTDHVGGAIVVDFEEDISDLKGLLKPLLLEALANKHASIEEFHEWEEVVEKNRLRLTGRMQASGLQRVLSIMDPPAALQDFGPSSHHAVKDADMKTIATQQYFQSVSGLVENLAKKPHETGATTTTGLVGMWYDRFAKKIDSLPLLDVDPLAIQYGQYVAKQLRGASEVLRDVGPKKRVRQMNSPHRYRTYSRWGSTGSYGGRYGGYYGGGWAPWSNSWNAELTAEDTEAEVEDRLKIGVEERTKAAMSARDCMDRMEEARIDVRRKLTEKYHAEF